MGAAGKKTASKIFKILSGLYPGTTTALTHEDPLELLVATILSAQCTDKRVNTVTKTLFRKYRSVEQYARADMKAFERDIHSTGFYRNKSRNIIRAAKMILEKFRGEVPGTMTELLLLPGVARKTANVVLYHCFGKNEGIAVDTHVKRLSGRLSLSEHREPVKIERDLMGLFAREKWGALSDLLIEHGRSVCAARRPRCGRCRLGALCPSKIILSGEAGE